VFCCSFALPLNKRRREKSLARLALNVYDIELIILVTDKQRSGAAVKPVIL